jgi:ankyrin repeat protein
MKYFLLLSIVLTSLLSSACTRQTLLARAIYDRNIRSVEILLEAGASPSEPLDEGGALTPLIEATVVRSPTVAQVLIDHGADVNAITKTGTALQSAAISGDCQMIKLLVGNGAQVDLAKDRFGSTALMSAIAGTTSTGKLDGVKCLLELGASVNVRMKAPSVLRQAVFEDNPALVQMLLDAGADPTLQDDCGRTAEDYAAETLKTGIFKHDHTEQILQLLHSKSGQTSVHSDPPSDDDCTCRQ